MMRRSPIFAVVTLVLSASPALSQKLTLKEAEAAALANHPRISAAAASAEADPATLRQTSRHAV